MRLRLSAFVLALTLVFAAAAQSKAPSRTPVPRGFVGMNLDGPPLTPQDHVNLAAQFASMVRSGVQSVRVTFSWAEAQPYAKLADVPAGQASDFQPGAGKVPTSFAATDQIVKLAAEHGLSVRPVVIYTPGWDAAPKRGKRGLSAPKRDQPYGDYLRTLIRRYGPAGSFWSQHRGLTKRPIRMWEVWNEPDVVGFWPIQPYARSYVALLRAAHAAIKKADPGAKVVVAGFPNVAWKELETVYKVKGARRLFDAVDVHPYTKQPAGVIRILNLVRNVMNKVGDARKPIIVGETGWPSSLHQAPHMLDFEVTQAAQARNISSLLRLLGANRRRLGIIGFDYYTWMGDEHHNAYTFNFSGLLKYSGGKVSAKPALAAFTKAAHALEH
jgi:hypothetical protein